MTGSGINPEVVTKLGKKVDGVIGDAWDAAKDAPLLGVGRYGPLGPNLRDMLGEDEQQVIDKAPPQDAPDLDTQETIPDQSDDRGFGGTLVFPDGSRYDDLSKLPPSEDQSDILPQGTILNIKDSKGNEYDWDVSGAHPKNVRNAGGNLDQISNPDLADRLKQVTAGAKLKGEKGDRGYIKNIEKPGGRHPEETAGTDYSDLVRSVGGDPSRARDHEFGDGSMGKYLKLRMVRKSSIARSPQRAVVTSQMKFKLKGVQMAEAVRRISKSAIRERPNENSTPQRPRCSTLYEGRGRRAVPSHRPAYLDAGLQVP